MLAKSEISYIIFPMKNNPLTNAKISIMLLFSATIIAFNFFTVDVKYSQFFADKKIVLTEKLTLIEQIRLPSKKGFVSFEL